MTESRTDATTTELQSRLRELQQEHEISPEIAELRLMLLRREVPEALVQIDAVRADDTAIAVKAIIGLPGGARNSTIASADVDADSSWSDQLEQVQAQAIVRVLDGLTHRQPQRPTASGPANAPQASRTAVASTATAQAPTGDADHLPEYSWNAFWQTVNSRNISREQVEQALGKSVQEVTPKEAVDALKSAGML